MNPAAQMLTRAHEWYSWGPLIRFLWSPDHVEIEGLLI